MLPEYFKVLNENQASYHGGSGKWSVGRYRSVRGPIMPCENGIHFVRLDQLVKWLGPAIHPFEVKPGSEIVDHGDKLVCQSGRIGPRFETWNPTTQRLFAADCAEHVLHLFTAKHPGDDRPFKAIVAARQFARGEIGADELSTARVYAAAAYAAAADAADAAYAAYAAAAAAAAAYAAAYADAAAVAADAAYAAYAAAAAADAYAAEGKWQANCLAEYLNGTTV